MRISLNWLRELVSITLSPEDLAHTLTMAGFEVEDIEDRRTWAEGVVLGRILGCEPHPNADKLRVCQVDIGGGKSPLNIVCGAPNARPDIYVPVAVVGASLAYIDLKIKPTKLRGVPSEGMICSLAELGLMKESAGIHIFEEENLPPLGTDIRPLLGLDDVILDLTATANRADALSMVGVAREVGALTGAPVQIPSVKLLEIPSQGEGVNVTIEAQESCPTYIGTQISGVKIAPSPEWLQQRLKAAGVRPINNVVDVTNYILLEWGQPLHAFDQDRLQSLLQSSAINLGVRFAQLGETLKTLDGQTRSLESQNLLIVANDRPIALAGVMGGEDTEVHEQTANLILEAAIFDSATIRRSARVQGLRTESSTRYERGVNQAALITACHRAISLIKELAGGQPDLQKIGGKLVTTEEFTRLVDLRLERVNQVLGTLKRGKDGGNSYLQASEIEQILTALGCQVKLKSPGSFSVTIPPYRYRDLEREIDLIEEIARLHGYDQFEETLPGKTSAGYFPLEQQAIRQIREAFRAAGLTELMHYSLGKTHGENQVVIENPLWVEYSALRTEMLTGLVEAFEYNLKQGNPPLNGFEIGKIFSRSGDSLKESEMIAGVIGGDPTVGKWRQGGKDIALTWFEAKGLLESVFQRLGITVDYQSDSSQSILHPGRTAALILRGKKFGLFGQLHPQLQQERELPEEVYLFQLQLENLLEILTKTSHLTPKFKPYSSFPAAARDLAFFAAIDITVMDLTNVMKKAAGNLLESIELFDEYRGQNVPEGQRSLAFRLIYRTLDRTLTDTDIDPVQQKVRDALLSKFSVTLRS